MKPLLTGAASLLLVAAAGMQVVACDSPSSENKAAGTGSAAATAKPAVTSKATAGNSARLAASVSAAVSAKPVNKGVAELFLGKQDDSGAKLKRGIVGGLSVVWPDGWVSAGGGGTERWYRSADDKAGVRIVVKRAAKLPDEVKADFDRCNTGVFAASNGKLHGSKVQWGESKKGFVGEQKFPAMITTGFGPKVKAGAPPPKPEKQWELHCINAHVGDNKVVHGLLMVRKTDAKKYQPIVVEFVRRWRG